MFALIWNAAVRVHGFCQRRLPSNIVLRHFRTRRNLTWAPLVGVTGALVYGALFYLLVTAVQLGASGWLYLLALICFWSAIKFLVFIPISTVALLTARAKERRLVNEFIAVQSATPGDDGSVVSAPTNADRQALLKALRE